MAFDTLREVEDALLSGNPSVKDLYEIWGQRSPIHQPGKGGQSRRGSGRIPWIDDLRLVRCFTASARGHEEFVLVLDAAREILSGRAKTNESDFTEMVLIRMDYAASLARLGFTVEARQELDPLVLGGQGPELGRKLRCEILLQLGHILRDESHFASDRQTQRDKAGEALKYYRLAHQADPTRLEALVFQAAAALLLEPAEQGASWRESQDTAHAILALTDDRENAEGPRFTTTWARAIAESVLGKVDEAAATYSRLAQMHGVKTPDLAAARYYARFLAEAAGKPREFFNKAFPPLQLIVFAGHLPDLPGQAARFPPDSVPLVREQLGRKLREMGARVGMASASAGADLLFIDALREQHGTLHLVLPWSLEEFRRTSVRPYEPAQPYWEPLFDQAIETAATMREIGQMYEPSNDAGWEFMIEVTGGIALQTARVLRLDIQPLLFWDGKHGRAVGGTDSFHSFWERHGHGSPEILEPPPIPPNNGRRARHNTRDGCQRPVLHQEIKSMLFADIVGYSKLTESVIPDFIQVFLERVSRLAATSRHAPHSVNTWGDAVYAVFDFVQDAGLFALELAKMVQDGKDEWLQRGLYWEELSQNGERVRHALNIRIGLHTGPVFMHYDPVVRRIGFTGAHVSRAARIEPITKPGEVYASEEFAAMAELADEKAGPDRFFELGFACEYAGTMALAKDYPGRFRIYRLVPRRGYIPESLARAVHEGYREDARKRGLTKSDLSMLPWEDLSEDLREANRAQVADIPNKLRQLGFELTSGRGIRPSEIQLDPEQVERLARKEHERWRSERATRGWKYALERDDSRKRHPLMVDWEQLSEDNRETDRGIVRGLARLVEGAGLRVVRIERAAGQS
jgi:class 3 adenylate cyclase